MFQSNGFSEKRDQILNCMINIITCTILSELYASFFIIKTFVV